MDPETFVTFRFVVDLQMPTLATRSTSEITLNLQLFCCSMIFLNIVEKMFVNTPFHNFFNSV